MSFPRWVWWYPDESETGLLGFETAEDRDAFARGEAGPFRRVVADDGRTIAQKEGWCGMIDRLCDEAGVPKRVLH